MQTTRQYQGMTAREIIDGQDGETNGGDRMTGKIIWNYRTTCNADGTLQSFGRSTVCRPEDADVIGIDDGRILLEIV